MDDNKKFWERFAKLYAPIQEKSNRALYQQVAALCAPYVTNRRVLELACGSGQFTIPLWERAAHWEATDFSPKMIAETRKLCPSGVHTAVQDATALTYDDQTFDVVLMANALHIMPEPGRALEEIRRVLTEDGVLLVPTFVYEGKVNRLRMWVTTLVGFKTYYFWDSQGLRAFLEEHGFEILALELLPADPVPEAFVAVRKKRC